MKSSSSLKMGVESEVILVDRFPDLNELIFNFDSAPICKLELDFISMDFLVALASLSRLVLLGKSNANATPVLLLFEEKAN